MEMEKSIVRDVVIDGGALVVFFTDGDVKRIPLTVVAAAPDMQQALEFLRAGFRPLLKTSGISTGLRFGMASVLATADAALNKAERGF